MKDPRLAGGLLAAAVITLGLLTGCGSRPPSDPTPSAPASAPASTAPSNTPEPTTSGCPDGAYRITGLTGKGAASRLGTGTGGSLTMTFQAGQFTVGSDGSTPMKLDVGPGSAELRLDGTITGSYSDGATSLSMRTTDATGTATVKGFGIDRQVSARTIADQLLPGEVSGTATCTDAGASLDLPNVTLELARS